MAITGTYTKPAWMLRLQLTRYLADEFEIGGFFYEWKSRIVESHTRESANLTKRYADSSGTFREEDQEYLSEDYYEIERLTASLFATLIVAMWARLEFLLTVLGECAEAASNPAAASKQRHLYKFHEILASIQRSTGVDVTQIQHFDVVNAIRIMNNSYKHSDGTYDPNPKYVMDKIDPKLLIKWDMLDDRNRILFEKLPYDEITDCCKIFCQTVRTSIDQTLHAKPS